MCYIEHMKTRFFNARILPMDVETALFTGELHTDGDRIAYVGPGRDPQKNETPFDREIDCKRNLLLPGFKNAHAHSAMTFLRSMADDMPLSDWLFQQVFPREAQLTPEDVYTLTKLAILEYLTSGITCIADMYLFRDSMAAALVDSGFRGCVMDAVNDFGGGAERTLDEYRRINTLSPLVKCRVSIHGEYTTSLPLIREMAELARDLREPMFVHMNETVKEVEECIDRHGKRPFEVLDEQGAFTYGGMAYHCVHTSPNERDIIKQRGIYVVTCPASNMKLASGVAPLVEYRNMGIPVAIGTDGPASNNCLDMFREMFLVTGLQKLRHGADAMDALDVLEMACSAGAHACGFPETDCLKAGKLADVVLLDLQQPNMQPMHNIPKNVVYSGSKQNVALTMVGGKILYERGSFFIGEEPDSIYEKAAAVLKRMH